MSDIVKKDIDIEELEKKMLELEQAECPVIHRFSPGLYIREVRMPAGALAIGHYQKKEHLNLFLEGKIRMLNDDGSTTDLKAPMIFTGKPGRKMGYTFEEIVWLNIYPTDETDIETLEETYLDKSEGWLENKKKLDELKTKRLEDVSDYNKMLEEFGYTEEEARQQSENEEDQIPMPPGDYKFLISNSDIEGKGVFATAVIEPGEIIGPAKIEDKRTPLGRYANHCPQPNAKMKVSDRDIYLVAILNICGCRGGINGDEITTDYRKTLQIGDKSCQQSQQQ